MIWRFPSRSEDAWVLRPATWLVLLTVLAGGVCPALYGDQVPHEHLFVGGSPPAGWESHAHPNPLVTFLDRSANPIVEATTSATTPPGKGLAPVRVISVYDGMVAVLSIIAVTVAIPCLASLPRPDPGREVVFVSRPLRPLTSHRPMTPPPRSALMFAR
ncbi:MAG: hypothetical protein ACRDIY_16150 [Chloroflexota bacterium]